MGRHPAKIWLRTALVGTCVTLAVTAGARAEDCGLPLSSYSQTTIFGVSASDFAKQTGDDRFDAGYGDVAVSSDNALIPQWREACGFHLTSQVAKDRIQVDVGGSMPFAGSDLQGLAAGDGDWHSYTTLGSDWSSASNLVGASWEGAYAGRLDAEGESLGNHFGLRGALNAFDERLRGNADFAFSQDGEELAIASATGYRLEADLWRGDSLQLSGFGQFGWAGPEFVDETTGFTADQQVRVVGGALAWKRLDFGLERRLWRDNLGGSLDRTTRWAAWRGHVGFDTSGWHAALPDSVTLVFDDEARQESALDGDTLGSGPRGWSRNVALESRWSFGDHDLTFALRQEQNSDDYADGTSAASTSHDLLFGYSHERDDWSLATGASFGQRFDQDDDAADRHHVMGLGANFTLLPDPWQEIVLDAGLDIEQGRTDPGVSLEDASIDLTYRLKF